MDAPDSGAVDLALTELARGASRLNVTLSPAALRQFATFIDTLLLWRQRLSLTTAATPVAVIRRHVLDSLHVAPLIADRHQLLDIGSGAGFPAIPLAIACPAMSVVMAEARRKRANFLREVIRQTGVRNAQVLEERITLDTASPPAFDAATSRAFGAVAQFLSLVRSRLCAGGLAIAMRGPAGMNEAEEYRGYAPPEIICYRLSDGAGRVILIYRRDAF